MCACDNTNVQTDVVQPSAGRDFSVGGMNCQPCATKVTHAVRGVPGVTDATVDLAAGRVTVAGSAADSDITAAITEAGYTVNA